MSALPKTTRGVRFLILTVIVLAVLFVAYKVSYTNVPPERVAVSELITLAGRARTAISEAFADRGTLEGMTDTLLPPTISDVQNSKGPFVWTLDADGTLTGTSERYQVSVIFRTADHGVNWTCEVAPMKFAPRAGGICAVDR